MLLYRLLLGSGYLWRGQCDSVYGEVNMKRSLPGLKLRSLGKFTPTASNKSVRLRDGRFGSKVGQIGPKWDKSGAFSAPDLSHLGPI